MKKATWLFSSVIAALLTTGAPAVVSAENVGPGNAESSLSTTPSAEFSLKADDTTSTAEADTTAQVDILAGNLSLKAVPNLNFGQKTVQEFIDGQNTFGLNDAAITGEKPGYDGNSNKLIQVEDYRGSNNGWNLTASLDNFTGPVKITPTGLSLKGNIDGTNLKGTFDIQNIVGSGTTVIDATAATGAGSTTATLSDATLTLPENKAPKAGTYQAKVVWTLSSVAPTPAPEEVGTPTE